MTKRLQVLLDETELAEIQALARQKRVTVADWVRQALREARLREPSSPLKKLEAIRKAYSLQGPTADIEELLADIERGSGRLTLPE